MATITGTDQGETINEGSTSGTTQSNTVNALGGDDTIVSLRKTPYHIIVDGERRAVNFYDRYDGGAGFDTWQGNFGGSWSLNAASFTDSYANGLQWGGTLVGIERFLITAYSHGSATTGDGNDVIDARVIGGGASAFSTGAGDDQVSFAQGDARIDLGSGRDRLTLDLSYVNARTYLPSAFTGTLGEGYGGRYYVAGAYSDVYFSGVEDFTITTAGQGDTVVTGDGDDVVTTNAGDDVVTVGRGIDVIAAGDGVDTLSIDLSDEAQGVTIDLRLTGAQQSGGRDAISGVEAFQGAVIGTGFADVLVETVVVSNAAISGGAGNDVIQVSRGEDVVDGGADRDRLVLDYTYVNARTYMTVARTGDLATGYAGRYYIAGAYAQTDFAGIEDFTILTSNQGDTIVTGDGNDVVSSAGGNDVVTAGKGNDVLAGGDGIDTLSIDLSDDAGGVTIDLRLAEAQQVGGGGAITGFEAFQGTVTGSAFADVLVETVVDSNAAIDGGAGNDVIQVSRGTDTVEGGADRDRLVLDYSYIDARTYMTVARTGDLATGYAGRYYIAGAYAETSFAGIEDFTILTSNQGDTIVTGDGNDVVASAGGDDTVAAGLGDDRLDGGAGTDALSIDLSDESAGVTIDLSRAGEQQTGGSGSIIGFESFAGLVTGSAQGDVLIETAVARDARIVTGRGDDLVQVSQGTDVVVMGAGNDRLVLDYRYINARVTPTETLSGSLAEGYAGQFYIAGAYARTTFSGVEHFTISTLNLSDVLVTGDGDDILSTAGGDDVIQAAGGVNTVDGGAGTDGLGIDLSRQTEGVTIDLRIDGAQQTRGAGTVTGIESFTGAIIGSAFDDVLIERAEDFAAQFTLGAGNDLMQVSRGLDMVDGGTGSDRLVLDYSWINARAYLDGAFGGTAAGGYNGRYYIAGNYADTRFTGIEHFTIRTAGQGDLIVTGDGDDDIATGAGNDAIAAGAGTNVIDGGDGIDTLSIDLSQQAQAVRLDLTLDGAQQRGGTGSVRGMESFGGTVIGSRFNDVLSEGAVAADATIQAGRGNDTIQVSAGADTVDGGADTDRLILDYRWINARAYMTVALSAAEGGGYAGEYYLAGAYARTSFTGIEAFTIRTAGQNDTIVTGDGADEVDVGAGDDTIAAGGGADTLYGGDGNDRIDGGAGVDRMWGGAGNDSYVVDHAKDKPVELENEGYDTIEASVAWRLGVHVEALTLTGEAGTAGTGNELANAMTGNAGDNRLDGRQGDDVLTGGAGNDTLIGGAGNDTMRGGLGDDIYYVDAAGDVLAEAAGGGFDTVQTTIDYVLPAEFEKLILTGAARIGTGNDGDNQLLGGGGGDTLSGAGGADIIQGNAGNDTIDGGAGDDNLSGGAGRDTLTGGTGADRFTFRPGDLAIDFANADRITDFRRGDGDRIVLAAIDANEALAGDQAFAFVGTAAFSNVAGQLRYAFVGQDTLVEGDMNGDAVADLAIRLTGRIELVATDFVL